MESPSSSPSKPTTTTTTAASSSASLATSTTTTSSSSTTATSTARQLPPMDLKPTSWRHISSGPLGMARWLVERFTKLDPIPHRTIPPSLPLPLPPRRHVRLINVGVSHYCEKIRWALDLLEQEQEQQQQSKLKEQDSPNVSSSSLSSSFFYYYTEDAHAPPFVSFFTLPASQGKASVSPMILIQSEEDAKKKMNDKSNNNNNKDRLEYDEAIWDSNVLLLQLCPQLYPSEIRQEIQDMEQMLGCRVGATVRCYCYHSVLQPNYYNTLADLVGRHISWIEATLFRAMLPRGIHVGMRRALKINSTTAEASRLELLAVFEELSQRLEHNGGQFLMDDTTRPQQQQHHSYGFTAADLTLAALAFPLLRPPEMKHFLLSQHDQDYPPEALELSQQLRATKAGQHVLRIYREYRPTTTTTTSTSEGGSGVVVLKSVCRDRWPWKELAQVTAIVGIVVAAVATAWPIRK